MMTHTPRRRYEKTPAQMFNGKMLTMPEIAAESGKNLATLYRKRKEFPKLSMDEVIELMDAPRPPPSRTNNKFGVDVTALAKQLGITIAACKGRLERYGLEKTIELGSTKLKRGGAYIAKKTARPTFKSDLPETDEDYHLKNLIKSLSAQGASEAQIQEQLLKRMRF